MLPPSLPLSVDDVIDVASVVPLAAPVVPRSALLPFLDLPPAPQPPTPLSLGLLCPPALPLAPPPPALNANINHRYKDVVNQTSRGEVSWSTTGEYAPHGKFPSSPLAMVGYGINRPLFLHQPQQ